MSAPFFPLGLLASASPKQSFLPLGTRPSTSEVSEECRGSQPVHRPRRDRVKGVCYQGDRCGPRSHPPGRHHCTCARAPTRRFQTSGSWSCIIIIGSAEALPILCVRYFRWERERDTERERERDGSDVTIFARLAMNSHFHLPKIRTIGDELTLSLAKNSHFSFLPSHFPSLPSRRGHHCGAEIRNEFTLSIAQNCFALFVPPLSNGTSRTTSDRKPKTNDQILPSPILFFPLKNWIKLIPKTIGNRKRDCAWGGSGW